MKMEKLSEIPKMDDVRLASKTRDPQVLEDLSKSKNVHVLIEVAKNIHANSETLDSLKDDECKLVVQAVARNISTSAKTLAYLSRSKSVYVRIYVARNSNADLETLERLKCDEWGIVCQSAKWNLSNRQIVTLDVCSSKEP